MEARAETRSIPERGETRKDASEARAESETAAEARVEASEEREAEEAERLRKLSAAPPSKMLEIGARPSHSWKSAVTSAGSWSEFLRTNPSVE